MKALTVLRIDTPLAQRLKVVAAQERVSMKALAEEYISHGLAQSNGETARTPNLSRLEKLALRDPHEANKSHGV